MLRESSAYELFLNEGRLDHARKTVVRFGERLLGPAPDGVKDALANVEVLERLERMADLALEGKGWDELLQTP